MKENICTIPVNEVFEVNHHYHSEDIIKDGL